MTKSHSFLFQIIFFGIILLSNLAAQNSKNYDKELRRLNAKIDRVRVLVDSLEFNDRLLLPELMSAFRQAVSSKSQQDSITLVIMKRINTMNNKIVKLEIIKINVLRVPIGTFKTSGPAYQLGAAALKRMYDENKAPKSLSLIHI